MLTNSKEFLDRDDVMRILDCSRNKAYTIIRALNKEMEEEGYYVVQGKVNRKKFEDKFVYHGSKGELETV